MEKQGEVSRRQILTLGGVIAAGAAVTGLSVPDAAAESGGRRTAGPAAREFSNQPCIGEPGYAGRAAKLFQSGVPR